MTGSWDRALGGLAPAFGLALRRMRVQAAAWSAPLVALSWTAPSYESVYPSLQSRGLLVEAMRESPGTRLLYGVMPLPGTIGQLVQWEIGTWLVLGSGLMALLMTCRLLRGDEEAGLVEALRGAGVGTWVPVVGPLLVVGGAVMVLGLGVGLSLWALSTSVVELTSGGAWALAAAVVLVGWAFMAVAAVACQVARSAGGARGLALGAVLVAFVVRVAADELDASWLRWATPLAWRDLVEPYTADRMGAAAVCATICAVLVVAAGALHSRRDYRAGYLPDRSASSRRWRVGGHGGLLVRLGRAGAAMWALAAAAIAGLFGAMSRSVTDLLAPGSATARMVDQMAEGSPVQQFLSLLTVFSVLIVVVSAVSRACALASLESRGPVELEISAGVSRTRLFWSQALAAAVQGAALLMVSGLVLAAVTATQISDDHAVARALVFTISQFPGLLAAVGLAMALVGLAPRAVALVWAVIAWSGFAQFLGALVELPDWAIDVSVVGHHLDVVGPADWIPLAVQLAVGALGAGIGWAAYLGRDLGA